MVAPVLSVAVIMMIPGYEYEPGGKPVGSILTPIVLPLPPSVPDVAERTTHGFSLVVEVVQWSAQAESDNHHPLHFRANLPPRNPHCLYVYLKPLLSYSYEL